MVFVEKAVDSKSPGLYYLIYWKDRSYAEDTWKPIERVFYLRQLLKKYHSKNPEQSTATSLLINKSALPLQWPLVQGQKLLLIYLELLALSSTNILLYTIKHFCQPLLYLSPTNAQLWSFTAADRAKSLRSGFNTLRNTYAQHISCKSWFFFVLFFFLQGFQGLISLG